MEKPLVVSFSGGRTSAFMSYALKKKYNGQRELLYVFANTGKERHETLDFINECDKRWQLGVVWLEYNVVDDKNTFKVVSYETASRNGEPFERMIARYGIPNKPAPRCTSELKREVIRRYLRSVGLKNGMYEMAIGIRIDEVHRINWETAKENHLVYPLVTEFRATKQFVREWWSKQDFDLRLKDYEGNCDMCWKKSERKLLTLILEQPHLIEWWNEMEMKYGNGEHSFYRNNKTAADLIEMSKRPFTKSTDEYESGKCQTKLFDYDYDLDIEYDCFCKTS